MELTDEQKIILNNCDTACYISAAPGSGKSTMLSKICEKLLGEPNNKVLLVTFTNKAAGSIIDKCKNVDQTRIMGGTFHGIAYKMLREGGMKKYICDEHKKRLIIKKIFNCKADREEFERIYEIISIMKSKYPLNTSSELISRYQSELDKYNLIDFDDIIYNFISTCNEGKLGSPKFSHILVDELQDTSGPQLEMLKCIENTIRPKMIGVADDDQSIYAWRGARPENVRDFITTFGCTVYNMGYNFRSSVGIVEHARTLIENNKQRLQKVIRPFKTDKGLVSEFKCNNHYDEIDYVVMKCRQNTGKRIAILYRNRTLKNHLEFELRKAGLKYEVNDFLEITDRSAVKIMLSVLKICTKEFDLYDLQNASKAIKGFGPVTVSRLESESGTTLPVSTIFAAYAKDQKKNKRLKSLLDLQEYYIEHQEKNLEFLVREIEKHFNKSFDFATDMRSFLLDIARDYKINSEHVRRLYNELGLNGKEEHKDEDANIELSTVHGYKGLESEIVIIPWSQLFIPRPGESIEDERRLFYVAITRAKSKLYMSYSGEQPQFIKEMKL